MNVLAIGCHPDDVEICCAGTLAKCVKRGDRVVTAHLCNGSLGHVVIPPHELIPMRAEEARTAGRLAGIEVLDGVFDDLDIYSDNAESRNKVVEIIQYAQPDFIITQNPDDYMPDHVACSKLVPICDQAPPAVRRGDVRPAEDGVWREGSDGGRRGRSEVPCARGASRRGAQVLPDAVPG